VQGRARSAVDGMVGVHFAQPRVQGRARSAVDGMVGVHFAPERHMSQAVEGKERPDYPRYRRAGTRWDFAQTHVGDPGPPRA
jgi:hypothetical protein